MTPRNPAGISTLEYHVLLAMAAGPQYGYAIKERVEVESSGTLSPRAGSLYRVLARLMTSGLVRETAGEDEAPHPGRERRYYALTPAGMRSLQEESRRLKGAAALAEERLRGAEGRP